jgi:hypothetical protein
MAFCGKENHFYQKFLYGRVLKPSVHSFAKHNNLQLMGAAKETPTLV